MFQFSFLLPKLGLIFSSSLSDSISMINSQKQSLLPQFEWNRHINSYHLALERGKVGSLLHKMTNQNLLQPKLCLCKSKLW